jgi:hypothetical protein
MFLPLHRKRRWLALFIPVEIVPGIHCTPQNQCEYGSEMKCSHLARLSSPGKWPAQRLFADVVPKEGHSAICEHDIDCCGSYLVNCIYSGSFVTFYFKVYQLRYRRCWRCYLSVQIRSSCLLNRFWHTHQRSLGVQDTSISISIYIYIYIYLFSYSSMCVCVEGNWFHELHVLRIPQEEITPSNIGRTRCP